MLFEIKNLTKVYGDRAVLDIPELAFEKGTVYALLGPNGSGKTTLLEILSLLLAPTAGIIKYNNKTVDFTANNLTAFRREIVMVQQNPVLFTTTVFKNLDFGLKIRKIPKGERLKMIMDSLEMVGMGDFIGAEAHKLSGGETQRVAIARALTCSPKVMFFDEPTSNVDIENQIAIERILREINTQKNISVIFTTHNLTQASKLSRKIISLYEGRKVPSVFENIFSGKITTDKTGDQFCLIHEEIRLSMKTERIGNVKISIAPREIKILTDRDADPSKNLLRGRVIQLTEDRDHIRAIADIGIPLSILVPKERLQATPLLIGDVIKIHCPPESIQVF